jgi:MFS superfamily sulfate permease-like transporter
MSVFDQRGQKVTYQYNAAGNINFSAVENRADLVGELEKIKGEVAKARDAEVIDAELATDVNYHITKVVQQANKPEPSKNAILNHINTAKNLIKGVAGAGGLVTALMKVAELVQTFF